MDSTDVPLTLLAQHSDNPAKISNLLYLYYVLIRLDSVKAFSMLTPFQRASVSWVAQELSLHLFA
jgi:hypothetical protein